MERRTTSMERRTTSMERRTTSMRRSEHKDKREEKLPFTKEEDDLINQLHKIYGDKWFIINRFFKNRSPGELKRRYLFINRLPLPLVPKLTIKNENKLPFPRSNSVQKEDNKKFFSSVITEEEFRDWYIRFTTELIIMTEERKRKEAEEREKNH